MNTLLTKIQHKQATVAVVGLGYVGLPLAVEFGQAYISDVTTEIVSELAAEGLLSVRHIGGIFARVGSAGQPDLISRQRA